MYSDKFSVNIPPRWGVAGCLLLAVLSVTSAHGLTLTDTNAIPILEGSEPSQQCAGYCKEGTKFRLKTGSSYVYDYEALTVSSVTGTSNDTSQILLKAKADVHILSPCELVLKLNLVKLQDSGPTENKVPANNQEKFATALQKNVLRFSFQDGTIDQLCPVEDEPVWVLNIKRGILSAFQNSMKSFDSSYFHTYEADVNGMCETIYKSKPGTIDNQVLVKQKNLMQCIGRGQQSLMLPGIFSSGSQSRSAPLIKSEQICYQYINGAGHMSESTCIENHLFTPFSNNDSGISTKIVQNIKLENIIDDASAPKLDKMVNVRTSLKFDYYSENVQNNTQHELVEKTLEKLSMNSENGVTKDVPQLFALLVDQLKGFSYYQLNRIFTERNDQRAHKFLLDALPLVGTVDSILIMQDLFTSGDLSQEDVDNWLTSLLFYKKPTLQILNAIKYFLADGENGKTVLAISSMVHSYCTVDRECMNKQEVIEIMGIIENRLGESCYTEAKDETEKVIVTLKAIGNAGIFTRPIDELTACYKNTLNPLEVRLAAVSAFRRFSCKDIYKSSIIDLFYDQKQDVELRIAGYLAAMQCPTLDIVEKSIDLLYSDETFHVKSFVWTHLANLKESSSEWRRDIFHLLQEYKLPENITKDAKFYSRNFENSLFSESLDIGATVDSNVVFSTNSYLPRSATLNLTFDLFGEAINIFESGTRLEGFEDLIEDMFSKTGIFPEESLRTMLKSMRNASSDNEITADIKKHSDKFKAQKTFLEKPPRGAIFARIFGNELYLKQFYGLNELFENSKLLEQLYFNPKSIYDGTNIDYVNSMSFLDSNYIIPTAVGFPLSLNINGSISVGLKLKAGVELESSKVQNSKYGQIVFQVNPSATVQIMGSMMIDAKVTSSGVKSISTLNTNTYVDTKITVESDKLDVHVNLPREQMEVFDVSSNLFLIYHDSLHEIKGIEENINEWDTCSGNRVTTLSGLRLCSQATLRNASQQQSAPSFPLTGSFKSALILQKTDKFDSFHFQLSRERISNGSRIYSEHSVLFHTPGSTMNRSLRAKLLMGNKDVSLQLDSPMGGLELNARCESSELELQANVNKNKVFHFLLALRNYNYYRFDPVFNIFIDRYLNISTSGSANFVPGSKYSTDLQIYGLTKDPIKFSGNLNGKAGHYNLELAVKAPSADIMAQGNLRYTKTSFNTKAMIEYSFNGDPRQIFDIGLKLHAHKKGALSKYGFVTSLQSNKFSAYNSRFSWMLYHSDNYFDCITDLKVGDNEWNAQQMYHNYQLPNGDTDLAVKLSLSSLPKNLDYRVEFQYINTMVRTFVFGLAQLNENQQFLTNFDLYFKAPNDKLLSIELSNPWRGAYFNVQLKPTEEDVLSFNVTTGLRENKQTYRELLFTSLIKYYGSRKQNVIVDGEIHNLNVWDEPYKISLSHKEDWSSYSTDFNISTTHSNIMNLLLEYNEQHISLDGRINTAKKLYSGNFFFEKTEQGLSVSTIVDLERRLAFMIEFSEKDQTQLSEMKLYWDYQVDNSQSLIISFKNIEGDQQKAYIMMPGHYAAFDVKHLNEGLSSVNLTAVWGESQYSAVNAIKLSTAWLLSESGLTTTAVLTTPFVGFEHQAVNINLILSELSSNIKVRVEWQDHTTDVQLSCETPLGSKNGFRSILYINGTSDTFKNITLFFDYTLDSSLSNGFYTYNSRIEANYNSIENTKLQMDFSNHHDKFFKLLFTSPFQNYEKFLLSIIKKNKEFLFEQHWAKDEEFVKFEYLYELPYRAKVGFTSSFERYKLVSFEYTVNTSSPVYVMSITGILNEKYAICKIKGFQIRKVDQRKRMLSQIISTEIITEGNYLLKPFTANFTHTVDRNNMKSHFVMLTPESLIMDFNLTTEYGSTMLINSITSSLVTERHRLNGKFISNNIGIEEKDSCDYKFEGFLDEHNLNIALFGKYNLPNLFFTLNATSSLWNDDLQIRLLNSPQYLDHHVALDVKLPSNSSHKDSPSVLKFVYLKSGTDNISGELFLNSPLVDAFKAAYSYVKLNESCHLQNVEVQFKQDKRITADLILNSEKDEKFVHFTIQTPFYKDILLSGKYTNKENEHLKGLLLKALLGDETYTAAGDLFITNMAASANIFIDTPRTDKIIQTSLSYDIRQKNWTSDVSVVYFGSVTDFKTSVNWENDSEKEGEQWDQLGLFSKILFHSKEGTLNFVHNRDKFEIEFIDKRIKEHFGGSFTVTTIFNYDKSISVLNYASALNSYSLEVVHKHNDKILFNFKTETKYGLAYLYFLTTGSTPFENLKTFKSLLHVRQTNCSQEFSGVYAINQVIYELKGKMNVSVDNLTADVQFKSQETNLTFYLKYDGHKNYSLFIYALYNEEWVQGLTTFNYYKEQGKLTQWWQFESDFSKNGKHYKIQSGFDYNVLKYDLDFPSYPGEYYTRFHFDFYGDEITRLINYYEHYNMINYNGKQVLNIFLPYHLSQYIFAEAENTNITIHRKMNDEKTYYIVTSSMANVSADITFDFNINRMKTSVIVTSRMVNISAEFYESVFKVFANSHTYNCSLTAELDFFYLLYLHLPYFKTINFNSNIKNWEKINTVAKVTDEVLSISVMWNEEANAKLLLSKCVYHFGCESGNINVFYPELLSVKIDFEREKFNSVLEHYTNGTSNTFGASFKFTENQTIFNITSPSVKYDLKLINIHNNVENALSLELNNEKILSASTRKIGNETILTIFSSEMFSSMNATLKHKGIYEEENDKLIELQILKKGMKMVNFSVALFLNTSNKVGIESNLYTTVFSPTLKDLKLKAFMENGNYRRAVLYIQVNQPLIDFTGSIDSESSDCKILLNTPLGFTRYQLTSIQFDYNFISQNKSMFLNIASTNSLPYEVSAKFHHNNLTEINFEFNTKNVIKINNIHFYTLYRKSESIQIISLLDFNRKNRLYINTVIDSPLKSEFTFKASPGFSINPVAVHLNYQLFDLKKNIYLNTTINEVIYEFSGYLDRLYNVFDAEFYFNTNYQYGTDGYNTNIKVMYDLKENKKFLLFYSVNNLTKYKLNFTSLNTTHLYSSIIMEQTVGTSLTDYFNLKYKFMNETVFNLHTKLRMSLFGIYENSKNFEMQIAKNSTNREININIQNLWTSRLLEFHIQNSILTIQNLKWKIWLLNGNYSSFGDLHLNLNNNNIYNQYETENKYQLNSNLSLQNVKYSFESYLSSDLKFVFNFLRNESQSFFAEAQIGCNKYSKLLCSERHNYFKVDGLTKEPILMNYTQKITDHEKSWVIYYNEYQSSLIIRKPVEEPHLIQIEWENMFLSKIYAQLNLSIDLVIGLQSNCTLYVNEIKKIDFEKKSNYTSLTVVTENIQYKLEVNTTEIKLSKGDDYIYIKYSPLQENSCSFILNSTFNYLNNFNFNYKKYSTSNITFVDAHILVDKYNLEWKGEASYKGMDNFNTTFTEVKNNVIFTCNTITKPNKLSSLFQIEQNGIIEGSGVYVYAQSGYKDAMSFVGKYQNYSIHLDLESFKNKTFHRLMVDSNSPQNITYSLVSEVNISSNNCTVYVAGFKQNEAASDLQKIGEALWQYVLYTDEHTTEVDSKTVTWNIPSTLYDMCKTSLFIQSSWINLEETGLAIGKSHKEDSTVIKLFTGPKVISFGLLYRLETEKYTLYGFYINIPHATYQWKDFSGQTYLICSHGVNRTVFEIDSPLINNDYLVFTTSYSIQDSSKTFNLLLQQKDIEMVNFSIVSTSKYNFKMSVQFLENSTIECILQQKDNSIISTLKVIQFNEKVINMSLIVQENWSALLIVDKFLTISDLTAETKNKLDEFKLIIIHKLVNLHLGIRKNQEKVNLQLLIDSNIIKTFNLNAEFSVNQMSYQTNLTLNFADKFYAVNGSISLGIKNIDILIARSSSENKKLKQNLFKLGAMLTQNNEQYSVLAYANDNKFLGNLYSSNSKVEMFVNYLFPDLHVSGSFNFYCVFSPVYEIAVSYVGKSHYLNTFGKRYSVVLKTEKNLRSFEIKIDNKSRLVELNVFFNRSPVLVELNYVDDTLRTYNSSLSLTNNNNLFQLTGFINFPMVEERNFETIYDKKNKELQIRSDRFDLDAKIDRDNSSFSLESDLMEYTFKVNATIHHSENYKMFLLDVQNGENVTHFESTFKIDNDSLQVSGSCKLAQFIHSLHLTHHLSLPIDTHLSISSPLLPSGRLEAGVAFKDKSLMVFFSSGQTYLTVDAILDPKSTQINIKAPIFSQLDTATFDCIFFKERGRNELNRFRSSISFTSDNELLYQTSVKYEYDIDAHLLMSAALKTKIIDDMEIVIQIPLSLIGNSTAQISLISPKVQPVLFYFNWANGRCYTAIKCFGQTYLEFNIDYSVRNAITLDLNILKHRILLNNTDIGIYTMISVFYNNNKLFNLTLGFRNDYYWKQISCELETKFKGHEKYEMKFEMRNNEHKKILLLLSLPKIGSNVGFDLDYFCSDVLNNIITAKFHLPFIVPGTRAYGFSLINKIKGIEKIEVDYYIHVGDFLGSFSLFLKANRNNLEFHGKSEMNDKLMLINFIADHDPSKIHLQIDAQTPFNIFNQCNLHTTIKKNFVGSEVLLSYNSRTIFDFKIKEDKQKVKYFQLKSIWTSMSFSYLYNVGATWNLYNSLCFNNNVNYPDLCFEITYNSENKLNHYVNSNINMGSESAEIEFGCTHVTEDYEYFALMSWREKRILGFKFLREYSEDYVHDYLKYYLLEVMLPSYTIEASSVLLRTDAIDKTNIQFKWNSDNVVKKIGVVFSKELDDGVLINTMALQHFALLHDVVISTQVNGNDMKLIVEYSPEEKHLLIIKTGFWDVKHINTEVVGMKFVVEHEASNTFFQLLTNGTITSSEATVRITVNYINSTLNTIKYLDIFGGFDFGKKMLSINLDSNGNKFVMSASFWSKQNSFRGITVETKLNQKEPIRIELGINRDPLEFEVELNRGSSQTYNTYIGMPSNKEITGKVFHVLNGYTNTDVFVSLKLNTTKLLWGRFEFNTGTFADLYNVLLAEYSDVGLISSQLFKDLAQCYQGKWIDYFNSIGRNVLENLDFLQTSTSIEMQQLFNYFINFKETYKIMYEENQFYMKDIHNAWNKSLSYSNSKINSAVRVIVLALDSLFQATKQMISQVLDHLNIKLSDVIALLPDFKVLTKNIRNQTVELYAHLNSFKENFTEKMKVMISHTSEIIILMHKEIYVNSAIVEMEINNLITRTIYFIEYHLYYTFVKLTDVANEAVMTLIHVTSDMANIVVEGISSIREVEQLVVVFDEIKLYMDRVLDADYVFSILQNFTVDTFELVKADVNKNFKEYLTYLEKIVNFVEEKYIKFLQQPTVQQVIKIYQKIIWLWNYYNISDKNNTLWKAVLEMKSENLANSLLEDEQGEGDLYSPRYIFDSSKNSFEFYQRLPFEWKGFNEFPNLTDIEAGINQLIENNEDESSPNDSTFIEILKSIVDDVSADESDTDELFGRTKDVSAMIAGNNIFTFDGNSYVFAGACSYTLAGDLVTDSFSIILNYEMEGGKAKKKSLTVLTSDSSIEICWDYSVTVDETKTDLPIEIGSSTTIQRRVNTVIVHSLFGFAIECNFDIDICTFSLSLYNFGKTGGLLGTYNNHNFDDLTSPDGKILEVNEFVNSWVVGDSKEFDQCGIVEYLKLEYNVEDKNLAQYSGDCDTYFSSEETEFKKCFHKVDPSVFHRMCYTNLISEGDDFKKAMFLTVSSYINKCKHEGVNLHWPSKFSNCKEQDSLPASDIGQAGIISELSRSADIVFVVEQAKCTIVPDLGNLVSKLESALRFKQINSNRYAVVSFNGQILSKPHVKTINNKIWTRKPKEVIKMLTSEPVMANRISSSEPTSVYEALDFASSLPFRIGVSKTIILVSCNDYAESDDYKELMATFIEQEIKLHVVQNNAVRGFTRKEKMVFGVDINGAYTRRNVKSLTPSLPLLKKVLLPKYLTTSIALESNGTVFNLDLSKKALDVWSRVVTKSLEPKNCQIFQCVQQPDGVGHFISGSCSSFGLSKAGVSLKRLGEEILDEYQGSDYSTLTDYLDYSLISKNKR